MVDVEYYGRVDVDPSNVGLHARVAPRGRSARGERTSRRGAAPSTAATPSLDTFCRLFIALAAAAIYRCVVGGAAARRFTLSPPRAAGGFLSVCPKRFAEKVFVASLVRRAARRCWLALTGLHAHTERTSSFLRAVCRACQVSLLHHTHTFVVHGLT